MVRSVHPDLRGNESNSTRGGRQAPLEVVVYIQNAGCVTSRSMIAGEECHSPNESWDVSKSVSGTVPEKNFQSSETARPRNP